MYNFDYFQRCVTTRTSLDFILAERSKIEQIQECIPPNEEETMLAVSSEPIIQYSHDNLKLERGKKRVHPTPLPPCSTFWPFSLVTSGTWPLPSFCALPHSG